MGYVLPTRLIESADKPRPSVRVDVTRCLKQTTHATKGAAWVVCVLSKLQLLLYSVVAGRCVALNWNDGAEAAPAADVGALEFNVIV